MDERVRLRAIQTQLAPKRPRALHGRATILYFRASPTPSAISDEAVASNTGYAQLRTGYSRPLHRSADAASGSPVELGSNARLRRRTAAAAVCRQLRAPVPG